MHAHYDMRPDMMLAHGAVQAPGAAAAEYFCAFFQPQIGAMDGLATPGDGAIGCVCRSPVIDGEDQPHVTTHDGPSGTSYIWCT